MPKQHDRDRDDAHHDEAHREPYIHPEKLGPPAKLRADLEDVINLFDHAGTESDEPDIQADTPAP